jgi:hypothetical protein
MQARPSTSRVLTNRRFARIICRWSEFVAGCESSIQSKQKMVAGTGLSVLRLGVLLCSACQNRRLQQRLASEVNSLYRLQIVVDRAKDGGQVLYPGQWGAALDCFVLPYCSMLPVPASRSSRICSSSPRQSSSTVSASLSTATSCLCVAFSRLLFISCPRVPGPHQVVS